MQLLGHTDTSCNGRECCCLERQPYPQAPKYLLLSADGASSGSQSPQILGYISSVIATEDRNILSIQAWQKSVCSILMRSRIRILTVLQTSVAGSPRQQIQPIGVFHELLCAEEGHQCYPLTVKLLCYVARTAAHHVRPRMRVSLGINNWPNLENMK